MLKSKIHRATVTDANVDYEGSITIDRDLMDAANLMESEQVHVWDITNGQRLMTYVMEGKRGMGEITVNGAAARLIKKGDIIIIGNYADFSEDELVNFKTKKICVDAHNRIVNGNSH